MRDRVSVLESMMENVPGGTFFECFPYLRLLVQELWREKHAYYIRSGGLGTKDGSPVFRGKFLSNDRDECVSIG